MASVLLWLSLAVILLAVPVAAYASYRRHSRHARARSRAALNQLLAEADEIEQAHRAEMDEGGAPEEDEGGAPEQQGWSAL